MRLPERDNPRVLATVKNTVGAVHSGMRALPVLAFASLLCAAAAGAQDPAGELRTVSSCEAPVDGVPLRIREGLVYARTGGAARRFDMARPADRARRPAVVLIHGGGWAAGSRALEDRAMRFVAARGYVAVSIDYRLARPPRNTFPAAVSDVRCAVRRLRADAARYDIDPERIAAVGFSAGGHLAAMLAVASDVPELDDGSCPVRHVEPRIRGAVAWYAPFDLRTVDRPRWARVVSDFLGASPTDAPERAALASPIVHVSEGDAPIVMVHGTADPIVRIDQARAMHAALSSARVPTHLVEVPDAPHGFPFASPRHPAATCTTMAALESWLEAR